jgi:hypothetical protein
MMVTGDYFYLNDHRVQPFDGAFEAADNFLVTFLQEQGQPNSQERLPMPPNVYRGHAALRR